MKLTENSTPDVKFRVALFLLCAIFVACACIFVPYAGVQNDEVLFAGPLFHDHPREYTVRAFKHDVPLMLLSYLGAAKTWLFGAIFRTFHSGIWQLRLPVILIGAATLAALFLLFRRAAGPFAAATACLLLSLDPLYVLTTTFDWGPVALQHLLLACAMLYFVLACAKGSPLHAAAGAFAAGLGMWDKALFLWMASGAGFAALLLYGREMRAFLRPRMIAALVLGFVLGAAPLIVYNIRHPLKTFQGNFHFAPEELPKKARLLEGCLSGEGLDGYIPGEEWRDHPRQPRSALEHASVAIRDAIGKDLTRVPVRPGDIAF